MLRERFAVTALLLAGALWGVFTALVTASGLPQENAPSSAGREVRPGVYVPPNEQHPAVALPILQRSNHEVYVSVGGERSFMGAAVTKAQALVVMDYDPEIIRFARINRALLAVSRGRNDYVALRLKASAEEWRQRAKGAPEEDRTTLLDADSWTFWNRVVRNNTGAWANAFEHFNTRTEHPTDPFALCNYLFDDALYAHLQHLAKGSLIWARLLDLRHEDEVRKLGADLRAKKWKLSVVDTSNVPDASEAGAAAAGRYIHWFSDYAEDTTIFLNTERANRTSVSYWTYFAFTGKAVKGHDAPTIARWYNSEIRKFGLDAETHAVIDDPDAVRH